MPSDLILQQLLFSQLTSKLLILALLPRLLLLLQVMMVLPAKGRRPPVSKPNAARLRDCNCHHPHHHHY
jgi:hypothetical protein